MKHAAFALVLLLATTLSACGSDDSVEPDLTDTAGSSEKSETREADNKADQSPTDEETVAEEASPEAEPTPAANCPVGTWVAGDEDLDAYFDSMAAAMGSEENGVIPPDPDAIEASGTLTITFRADHTYQVVIDKLVNSALEVEYSSSVSGTENGEWTGDASAIEMTSTSVTIDEATQTVAGQTQPMDPDLLPDDGAGLSWGEIALTCEGSTLTSTSKGGAVFTVHAKP